MKAYKVLEKDHYAVLGMIESAQKQENSSMMRLVKKKTSIKIGTLVMIYCKSLTMMTTLQLILKNICQLCRNPTLTKSIVMLSRNMF
jgi:hypothetical protein